MGKNKFTDRFQGEGPFELTMEDIVEITAEYDLGFFHHMRPQPTKKEINAGAKPVPPLLGVYIDELGGRFRQR